MVTFDIGLSSEEDLDNIDNDNEVDDDVDESSSDNEEMKKILKVGKKKEADELNRSTNILMILQKRFVKMNIFEENLSSQIISHSKTKRCMKIKIQWDKNNLNSM